MIGELSLQPSEQISLELRSLYDSYGYCRYKMSKFEEYDLYSRNKDFLVSDSVITFTDTNGKLMALKPDVTLSIVKNTRDVPDSVQKLYYNENVYRVSKGSHAYKEIMQVGLECIGDIDSYCIYEVLRLALLSMKAIAKHTVAKCSILDISDLGLLTQVIDRVGIPSEEKAEIFRLIGEKNLHELTTKCQTLGIEGGKIDILRQLAELHGPAREVLPVLDSLLGGIIDKELYDRFAQKLYALSDIDDGDTVQIDFSVVDDIHYYNGIVFKGFVENIPSSVLSGGQYDKLMKKMKRSSGAIGFAVYLDMLEQFINMQVEYDADTVLLYDSSSTLAQISEAAERITAGQQSVLVLRQRPEGVKYRQLLTIKNGEVEVIEKNA